jgi:hypothetical protein
MMEGSDDRSETENRVDITRRKVLVATGAATAGVGAFAGTASAWDVTEIAFCGCSQVVVYGDGLHDRDYHAILYCGEPGSGSLSCAKMTGSDTVVNYEIEDTDCKVIGATGSTSNGGGFLVCNEYGPQNCADKALMDARGETFTCDGEEVEFECDDPDEFGIAVRSGGCGPNAPGGGNNGRR